MKRACQVIAICGGSGSGKSTLARKFVQASVLSTDHFYRNLEDLTPREDGTYDFDHPSSVALDECAQACRDLMQNKDVMIPVYDMRTCKRIGQQLVPSCPSGIIVIEGIFAFHNPLHDLATMRIFIDTPVDQRMARRLRRDAERGRSTLDIIRHSLQQEEAHERIIEPMRHLADLILMGDEIRGGLIM